MKSKSEFTNKRTHGNGGKTYRFQAKGASVHTWVGKHPSGKTNNFATEEAAVRYATSTRVGKTRKSLSVVRQQLGVLKGVRRKYPSKFHEELSSISADHKGSFKTPHEAYKYIVGKKGKTSMKLSSDLRAHASKC